jgi:hypothetical protein
MKKAVGAENEAVGDFLKQPFRNYLCISINEGDFFGKKCSRKKLPPPK